VALVVGKDKTTTTSQDKSGRWLWVPAFAGTTEELSDSIFKELTHLRILATRCARGLLEFRPPRKQRAQGRPGARCTRGLVCKLHNKKTHTSIQVQRKHSGLPRAMVLRLIARSPRRPAFLPPSPVRSLLLTNLTPASGRQDHTTSPSASRAFVLRALPRPPHPAPRFVTIMIRPSGGVGWGELVALICPTA
jgi:hypothetical protein